MDRINVLIELQCGDIDNPIKAAAVLQQATGELLKMGISDKNQFSNLKTSFGFHEEITKEWIEGTIKIQCQ